MEKRKCPECQNEMLLTSSHKVGSKWYYAYYQCTYCGARSAAAVSRSREEAVRKLEILADDGKLGYIRPAQTCVLDAEAEADRAMKTYGDYQELCEALLNRKTGKPAELMEAVLRMQERLNYHAFAAVRYKAKIDELLTADQKAKRDLEDYKETERRYGVEIAKLNSSLEYLQKRIVHLLGSKLIMSFDEITSSGEYKRNIEEADEYESKEAVQKIKRELAICESAYQRCEAENARLKEMAAEDILLAAQRGCPCASCANNKMGDGCNFEKCENCENHCVCYKCRENENFVWRGGK